MKAGKTNIDVGTKIRITKLADNESPELIGQIGEITHPFPGIMVPGINYICGVRFGRQLRPGAINSDICNLTVGDKFESTESEGRDE